MLWLTYAPVTTVAARYYGVSVGAVGWLAQIFPLVYVVLALPAGVALDRHLRAWLGTGAALTAVGAVLRVDGGFGRALAGQVAIAVAQPLVLNSVTKVATQYLAPQHRATGIALSSASVLFGIVLAFVLGSLFNHQAQLPTLVAVSAAYAVVAAVALAFALRRPGRGPDVLVAAGWHTLRRLLGDPAIRTLAVLLFAGVGVFDAISTWLEALLKPAGIPTRTADLLLLELVVAGVVGAAVLPPWAAARGNQRRVLKTALAATALGCGALAVRPTTVVAAVSVALTGFVLLTCLPIVLELSERRAGDAGASAAAVLWMAGNAGGLVVAVVVQSLVHVPAIAFLAMAATMLLAWPLTRRGSLVVPERPITG